MRVFKRSGEIRAPNEPAFRPGRARADAGADAPTPYEVTGFDDRAPTIGFNDVAGLDSVVQDLSDVVAYAADPGRYAALGARPPTGILLFGEPGCGKTLLGRALAGEVGVPFYFVSATSFVERFVGLGASRIRELFDTANRDSPCIVFIDEIDAIGRHRSDGAGDREFDHTLNQLLVELDGFLSAPGVVTIAATNRPELLDSALVRPGRFDRHIEVTRPDRTGREAVLALHASTRPCASDIRWDQVAAATDGCSSAALAAIVNEAALLAARHGRDVIEGDDVRSALDRLKDGGRQPRIGPGDQGDRRAAHEAGHALAAIRLPDAKPCVRASIMSCGGGTAFAAWSTSARADVRTGPQLLAELVVLMAGRAAEEVLFGSGSTLSEDDFLAASVLAERIARAELGDSESPTVAQDLLNRAKKEAACLVSAERAAIESIAAELRSANSMFVDEIIDLLAAQSGA